jgi:hypothetical protein
MIDIRSRIVMLHISAEFITKTFKNISLSFILLHFFFLLIHVNLKDIFFRLRVSAIISEIFLFRFRAVRPVLVKL